VPHFTQLAILTSGRSEPYLARPRSELLLHLSTWPHLLDLAEWSDPVFFAERCSSLPYWLRFLSDSSYYHHELNLCLPTTRAGHALLSYKRCLVLLPCSSTAMDSVSQRPLPHSNMPQSNAIQGQQSLPPLSQLTNRLPASEHSPAQPRQHTEAGEVRDSGHWSIAPSKREYTRYLSTTRC
jgi:hypothetical protein